MSDFNWCSPAHVYVTHGEELNWGIKGKPVDTHVSSKLTDKKIHQYALQGRYGFEAWQNALAIEEKKKPKKKKK